MEYTSKIDELIAKQLTGEIAAEEARFLEKWLTESIDNRQYFNQMQQLWEKSFPLELPRQPDVEAALMRTKAKLKQKPVKGLFATMNFWRYAAAAAILLLLGTFWLLQQNAQSLDIQLTATNNSLQDTLSDGSIISLNQYSSLNAAFSKKSRRVKMRGEAYFEVAHNPEKPFIIDVQQVEVTVVGTKFNIDNRSDPDWVVVSVEEGKVRVKSGTQTEFLLAGEQARINVQQGTFLRNQTKPSDNESAWANRKFIFDDTPLAEVIPLLEKIYKVKINLSNKTLEQCRLYVHFNNEPIERILLVIADTFSLEIKQINGVYFLDGSGCER